MPRSENVAVIGGGGFIGRPLVARLREAGCSVTVISRQAVGHPQPGVSYRRADVSDAGQVRDALAGSSVVYHLATGGGSSWADFERDFLGGAENVARACQAHGVRRLIYTSSSAALYLGGSAPVDESAGADPQPETRGNYSRAKILSERLLLGLHAAERLPVVICRPAVVVGNGTSPAHGGVGLWASDLCCLGWGRGSNPLPFVLVEDVASALLAAKDAPGIDGKSFNLAGDVRLSAEEFVRLLAERSLRTFRFYPQSLVKMQLIEIAKWALKALARKPGNTWPSYRDLKSRSMLSPMDCSAAKKLLGWQPVAERDVFLRQAIDSNLRPIPPGDLRLTVPQGG